MSAPWDQDYVWQEPPSNMMSSGSYCQILMRVRNGAKHSPPGRQGTSDWLKGVPPVAVPGPPLTYDNFGSTSSFDSFSTWLIIILNAFSNGIKHVSRCSLDGLEPRITFQNHENHENNDIKIKSG